MYNAKTNKYHGYIYLISNNFDDKVYVGQTINSIQIRFQQHKNDCISKRSNSYLHRSMRINGIKNFTIKQIDEFVASSKSKLKELLNEAEIFYIEKYNSYKPNGYNLTKGGNYVPIQKPKSVDAYNADGKLIYSFKDGQDAANFVDGRSSTIYKNCEGKCQYAYGYIWRYHGDSFNKYKVKVDQDRLNVGRIRKIDQYTTNGEFIKTFDSATDVEKEYGYLYSHILECCNNKLSVAYGYVWCFHNTPFQKLIDKRERKIIQCDLVSKHPIKYFDTIRDANVYMNKNIEATAIGKCCRGVNKSAYGYYWCFQ